ncbi:MAG TPA: hypothetical protein VKU01_36000 [Bryobacteraceae bacterium]|nr:hypothetical protein [Bryobacteraceae bacterium]
MSRIQIIVVLGAIALFGLLLPWYKGLDFLDPRIIFAYACLSAVMAAPASASAFSTPESRTLERIALIAAFGFGFALASLITALATVNLSHWHGNLLLPRTTFLWACVFLSAAAAVAVTTTSAFVAHYVSAQAIKTAFRFLFLLLIAALVYADRRTPQFLAEAMTTTGITHIALVGAAVLLALTIVLIVLLTMRRSAPSGYPES